MKESTAKVVRELATRVNVSDAKMIELLTEACIEDEGWLIKLVTSKWSKAIMGALGVGKKRRQKEKPSE